MVAAASLNYSVLAGEFIGERCVRDGERTLQFDGDFWWEWRGHMYHKVSDEYIKDRLLLWLSTKQLTMTRIRDEVYEHLRATVRDTTGGTMPRWAPALDGAEARSQWLAFTNGVLDLGGLIRTGTTTLKPQSPRWFSNTSIPYAFNPRATCPQFMACLAEWVPDEDARKVVQEFSGYGLHSGDCRYQSALFMQGGGNNGKSTLCDALRYAYGDSNTWGLMLNDFGKKYALAPMYGKLVNIAPETKRNTAIDTNLLKQFISGDPISFEDKYVPFTTKPNVTKLIVAWNNPPRIDDNSDGFWRRVLLVNFPNSFKGREDRGLGDRLKTERAGIMNWMIEGLKRLTEQGKFTECPSVASAVKDLKAKELPLETWLKDNLAADESTHYVEKAEVYRRYAQYADDEGHEQPTDVKIAMAVKDAFPNRGVGRAGMRRVPVFWGLRWKGSGNSVPAVAEAAVVA